MCIYTLQFASAPLLSSRLIILSPLKLTVNSTLKLFASVITNFYIPPNKPYFSLQCLLQAISPFQNRCVYTCVLGKCIFILHDPEIVSFYFLILLFPPFPFLPGKFDHHGHFCCHYTIYFVKIFYLVVIYLQVCWYMNGSFLKITLPIRLLFV